MSISRLPGRLASKSWLPATVACITIVAAGLWFVVDPYSKRTSGVSSVSLYAANAPAAPEVLNGTSCSACHSEITAAHAQSPHGRTLSRIDVTLPQSPFAGRAFKRLDTGVSFEYQLNGERLQMTSSASARSREVTWLFGSGRHAQTPLLTWLDAAGRTVSIEHSVSLYPDGQLDTTLEMEAITDAVGLAALGNYRSCGETANCFGCHSTWVPLEHERIREDEIVPGVGCLRCHTDAAGHAAAMEQGVDFPVERLSRLSPAAAVDRCGECHRRADELGAPLHSDNPTLARFASVGLVQSRCFLLQPHGPDQPGTGGAGRLDCLSCHSPHAETVRDWRVHAAVCLECHQPPQAAQNFDCPVAGPADNCLDCHMPKVRTGNRLQFTDHWIRRPKAKD